MILGIVLALILGFTTPAWAGFDMGFNFRLTAGFPTNPDPNYSVPVLGEAYPHTYTAANGFSINGGFTVNNGGDVDSASTNDPRIAGYHYNANTPVSPSNFQLDLSSGSAPGSGSYVTDFALGFASGASVTTDAQLQDDTTTLIDATNGGTGYAMTINHYIDATLADVTATTTWTGTPATVAFATTTVNLKANIDSLAGTYTCFAHFRLTKQTTAVSGPPQRTMTGVGL